MPRATALFVALAITIAGCHSSTGPTAGTVRFEDGSPVKSGSIEFRSLDSDRRYASRIDSDGRFQPEDKESEIGLPPGDYEVVVVQIVLTEDLAAEDHRHGQTVPRKYADYYTSGLRVSIEPNQQEDIEIVLSTE